MTAFETRRRPPGRYDEPSAASRVISVVAAALLAAGLLFLGYSLYDKRSTSRLDYQVGGYDVLSDSVVRVTFTVDTRGERRGLCRVRARNADGAEAGVMVIPVGPGKAVSYDLATTSRAVTGEVTGCRRT